jgi:hypothetical protein
VSPSTASTAPAKTVLADALAPLVIAKGRQVIRASVDDFHHPRAVRYARGRYSPDGFFLDSYDYPAFRRLLLDPLGPAVRATTSQSISIIAPTSPSRDGRNSHHLQQR